MSESGFITFWKEKARFLKIQTGTLYFAYRDPRVPWYAKAFSALVVAYAFSPIDLIPDFIPVLGYLDDLIIIPLGVLLAFKMIPSGILEECRAKAEAELGHGKPQYRWMAAVFILIWVLTIGIVSMVVYRMVRK